jgi:hypothetical protein
VPEVEVMKVLVFTPLPVSLSIAQCMQMQKPYNPKWPAGYVLMAAETVCQCNGSLYYFNTGQFLQTLEQSSPFHVYELE